MNVPSSVSRNMDAIFGLTPHGVVAINPMNSKMPGECHGVNPVVLIAVSEAVSPFK
jgi:hypothetical protein